MSQRAVHKGADPITLEQDLLGLANEYFNREVQTKLGQLTKSQVATLDLELDEQGLDDEFTRGAACTGSCTNSRPCCTNTNP